MQHSVLRVQAIASALETISFYKLIRAIGELINLVWLSSNAFILQTSVREDSIAKQGTQVYFAKNVNMIKGMREEVRHLLVQNVIVSLISGL
jgi:hypothetical protein